MSYVSYMSYLNYMNFLFLIFFSKNFREYIRMENPNYENEEIEKKYLNNMQKNQF